MVSHLFIVTALAFLCHNGILATELKTPSAIGQYGDTAALDAATAPLPADKEKVLEALSGNPNKGLGKLKYLEVAWHKVDPEHHIPAGTATVENGFGQAAPQKTADLMVVTPATKDQALVYLAFLAVFSVLVLVSMLRVWVLRASGSEKMRMYSTASGYAGDDDLALDETNPYDPYSYSYSHAKNDGNDDNSLSSSYLLAGNGTGRRIAERRLQYDGSYGAVI